MTNQPGRRPAPPAVDLRGAVDLSSLTARSQVPPKSGVPPKTGDPVSTSGEADPVLDITDATFVSDLVPLSTSVPVVLDFWAAWCGPCKQLSPVLERLAVEFGGRFVLAKVDVDANPQLSQAFAVQSIPSVFALIKGQPVPLFQGAQPEGQIRQVLTELLRVAQTNGVNGVYSGAGQTGDDGEEPAEEPTEEPLPPLHQKAYDAIEAGDYDSAVTAYEQALLESPADDLARIGLAQVKLLRRTSDVDAGAARAAAAVAPGDAEAQILVADLDLLGGHVEDVFARLIDTVRVTSGADRESVRAHLVELFEVVGPHDPRVGKARTALANALF